MNSSIATHFPGKSPVWSGVSGRCLIGMLVVCQHRTTQQMGVTQTGTHGRRTCLGFSAAAGCWPTSGLGYQMKLPAVQSGGFTPPLYVSTNISPNIPRVIECNAFGFWAPVRFGDLLAIHLREALSKYEIIFDGATRGVCIAYASGLCRRYNFLYAPQRTRQTCASKERVYLSENFNILNTPRAQRVKYLNSIGSYVHELHSRPDPPAKHTYPLLGVCVCVSVFELTTKHIIYHSSVRTTTAATKKNNEKRKGCSFRPGILEQYLVQVLRAEWAPSHPPPRVFWISWRFSAFDGRAFFRVKVLCTRILSVPWCLGIPGGIPGAIVHEVWFCCFVFQNDIYVLLSLA